MNTKNVKIVISPVLFVKAVLCIKKLVATANIFLWTVFAVLWAKTEIRSAAHIQFELLLYYTMLWTRTMDRDAGSVTMGQDISEQIGGWKKIK